MTTWENMNKEQRNNLVYYKRYLEIEWPTKVDEINTKKLLNYCLKNNLCVSELPSPVLFDETYKNMANTMSCDVFEETYSDFLFVNESGDPIDAIAIAKNNGVNTYDAEILDCELLNEQEEYYRLFLLVKYKNETTRINLNSLEAYQNKLYETFFIGETRKCIIENSVLGREFDSALRRSDNSALRRSDNGILKSPYIIKHMHSFIKTNGAYKNENVIGGHFKKRCEYLANESGIPSHMGELLLSEIKLGDKSCPEIVNRAVKIGLLPNTFWVDENNY